MKKITKTLLLLSAISALAGCSMGNTKISYKEFQADISRSFGEVVSTNTISFNKAHCEYKEVSSCKGAYVYDYNERMTTDVDFDKLIMNMTESAVLNRDDYSIEKRLTASYFYDAELGIVQTLESEYLNAYAILVPEAALESEAEARHAESVKEIAYQYFIELFAMDNRYIIQFDMVNEVTTVTEREFARDYDFLPEEASYSKQGRYDVLNVDSKTTIPEDSNYLEGSYNFKLKAKFDGWLCVNFSYDSEEVSTTRSINGSISKTTTENTKITTSVVYKSKVKMPDISNHILVSSSELRGD